MSFDKNKYINQYKKEHYSKLSVDLPKDTKEELVNICKNKKITIKQFIIEAIERARSF